MSGGYAENSARIEDFPTGPAGSAARHRTSKPLRSGKLHAFEITIDAEGKPISTVWRHNGFKSAAPSGLSSEDVFTKKALDGKVIEASYKSAAPADFFDNTYSFDVTFRAAISP